MSAIKPEIAEANNAHVSHFGKSKLSKQIIAANNKGQGPTKQISAPLSLIEIQIRQSE